MKVLAVLGAAMCGIYMVGTEYFGWTKYLDYLLKLGNHNELVGFLNQPNALPATLAFQGWLALPIVIVVIMACWPVSQRPRWRLQ